MQITLITTLVTAIMSLSIGVLLRLIKITKTKELESYNTSRKVMAYVYITLGLLNIGLFLLGKSQGGRDDDVLIVSGVYVIIASLQSLLLTYSIITLLDAYYVTRKKIAVQLVPVLFFTMITIAGFFIGNRILLKSIIAAFTIYYTFQLGYYTKLYFSKEKKFLSDTINFFSGNESNRAKWIRKTFLSALVVGIGAYIIVLFPSVSLLKHFFAITCIFFYLYFGIRYINYLPTFHVLMPVIAQEPALIEERLSVISPNKDLSQKLDEWKMTKAFTKPGITINDLAEQINTNRTYISNHINTFEKVNFNYWLNSLRIEEAQNILKAHPSIQLNELSEMLGYADQSSLSKQFKTITGLSPLNWRKENVN